MPHDEKDLQQEAPKEKQQQKIHLDRKDEVQPLSLTGKHSSFMNVGSTTISAEHAPILSGIMKLPELKDLNKPTKAMVLEAHKDVGLSLSKYNFRHPKRVKHAFTKYENQRKLAEKLKKKYEPDDEFLAIEVNRVMNLDLSKLMYNRDETGPDEILLNHYSKLQQTFAYIDSCEDDLKKARSKKAMTSGEMDDCFRQEAHIKTLVDLRTYYQVIESLMKNRYYALLPRQEMINISYNNLRVYLDRLYEKKPEDRNTELIDFYQNLLRLKTLGITDEKSVKKKEERYYRELAGTGEEDTRNAKDEMEKISDSYKKLNNVMIKKSRFYAMDDQYDREDQFFDVLGKDIEKFKEKSGFTEKRTLIRAYNKYLERKAKQTNKRKYNDAFQFVSRHMDTEGERLEKRDTTLNGIVLSDAQKEGIHMIQGFLLRRAWQEKKSKDAFVYNFIQSPPEQQLLAFYLIEKGKEKTASASDYYTAINNYQPNLDAFRDKMNKYFFSWGGTKWEKMSSAVQTVKSLAGDIANYAELNVETEKNEADLAEVSKNPEAYMEQGKLTIKALTNHIASLMQLYRNVGLGDDMPPDLAEDEKLREKMYTEYDRIGELTQNLLKILEDHPELSEHLKDSDKLFDARGTKLDEKHEPGVFEKAFKIGKTYKKGQGILNTVDGAAGFGVGLFSAKYKNFRANNAYYKTSMSSLSELSSIIGFIDTIVGAFGLTKEETASEADKILKWSEKANSLVGGAKGLVSGATNVLKNSKVISKEAKSLKQMGKAFDGIGLLTNTASTVINAGQLGRVIESGKDLKAGKKKLVNRTKGNKTSSDKKKLLRFFSHQARENKRMKITASINLAENMIKTTSSVLGMTGVLLPITSLTGIGVTAIDTVYNFLYNDRKRKKNIKETVNEYLGVDKIIEEMKKDSSTLIDAENEKHIRSFVRDEALGQLGYATYKECYNDICAGFAEFLYNKLFRKGAKDAEEWEICNDALSSLGFEKVIYKKDFGPNPKPSMQLILAKILG